MSCGSGTKHLVTSSRTGQENGTKALERLTLFLFINSFIYLILMKLWEICFISKLGYFDVLQKKVKLLLYVK